MKSQVQPNQHPAVRRSVIAVLCAVVLMAACSPAIEGTLALLTTQSEEITNVFAIGELGYELTFDANKPDPVAADEMAAVTDMPANAYTASVEAAEHVFEVTEEPKLTGYQFMGWGVAVDTTAESSEGFYAYAASAAADTQSGAAAQEEATDNTEPTKKSLVPVFYNEGNLYANGKTTKQVYAVWQPMSFIVSFNMQANDVVVPAGIPVTYQMAYSHLPVPERHGYTFLGWTLDSAGEQEVTHDTIVTTAEDHTLYAQWQLGVASTNFKKISITEAADEDGNGIADEISITMIGGGNYDKLCFTLSGLTPGRGYQLSFTETNNAELGNYNNAIYGSFVTDRSALTVTEDDKAICTSQNGVIASNGDTLADQNQKKVSFCATQETMYWIWNFGQIKDGCEYDFTIKDITLKEIEPAIEFQKVELRAQNNATLESEVDNNHLTLTFNGDTNYEDIFYPITGLAAGLTYNIKFSYNFVGEYVNPSKYDYGYAIVKNLPLSPIAKFPASANYYVNTPVILSQSETTAGNFEITFKATQPTHYWWWLMSGVKDHFDSSIDITITEISSHLDNAYPVTYFSGNAGNSGISINVDLGEGVSVDGAESAVAGQLCALTLSGDNLPEILIIEADTQKYVTSVSAEEAVLNGYATTCGAEPKVDWLTNSAAIPQSLILTLPVELMTEGSVITISGANLTATALDDMTYNDLTN